MAEEESKSCYQLSDLPGMQAKFTKNEMELFNDFQRRIQQFEGKLKSKAYSDLNNQSTDRLQQSRDSERSIAQFYQGKKEGEEEKSVLNFLPPQKILNPIVFNSSSKTTPLSGTLDKEQTSILDKLKSQFEFSSKEESQVKSSNEYFHKNLLLGNYHCSNLPQFGQERDLNSLDSQKFDSLFHQSSKVENRLLIQENSESSKKLDSGVANQSKQNRDLLDFPLPKSQRSNQPETAQTITQSTQEKCYNLNNSYSKDSKQTVFDYQLGSNHQALIPHHRELNSGGPSMENVHKAGHHQSLSPFKLGKAGEGRGSEWQAETNLTAASLSGNGCLRERIQFMNNEIVNITSENRQQLSEFKEVKKGGGGGLGGEDISYREYMSNVNNTQTGISQALEQKDHFKLVPEPIKTITNDLAKRYDQKENLEQLKRVASAKVKSKQSKVKNQALRTKKAAPGCIQQNLNQNYVESKVPKFVNYDSAKEGSHKRRRSQSLDLHKHLESSKAKKRTAKKEFNQADKESVKSENKLNRKNSKAQIPPNGKSNRCKQAQEKLEKIYKAFANNQKALQLIQRESAHQRQQSQEKKSLDRTSLSAKGNNSQVHLSKSKKSTGRAKLEKKKNSSVHGQSVDMGQQYSSRTPNEKQTVQHNSSTCKQVDETYQTNLEIKTGCSDLNNMAIQAGLFGNIEKLLTLLKDHCRECPKFAEEFQKLNM